MSNIVFQTFSLFRHWRKADNFQNFRKKWWRCTQCCWESPQNWSGLNTSLPGVSQTDKSKDSLTQFFSGNKNITTNSNESRFSFENLNVNDQVCGLFIEIHKQKLILQDLLGNGVPYTNGTTLQMTGNFGA